MKYDSEIPPNSRPAAPPNRFSIASDNRGSRSGAKFCSNSSTTAHSEHHDANKRQMPPVRQMEKESEDRICAEVL
jgi:hypothetical protein